MALRILISAVWLALLPAIPCLAAETNAPSAAADYSATRLLAEAQAAVAGIDSAADELERDIRYRTALTSLTGLYQLHGCQWAYPWLIEIATSPDCPETYYGISADGRLAVTIDRLELRNPIFEHFTIYLCTLASISAEPLSDNPDDPGRLVLRGTNGTLLAAENLTPGHLLWDQLRNLVTTFSAPEVLYPGSAYGFKQVFAVPVDSAIGTEALLLDWGGYSLELPVYREDNNV